jgi:hypothetical protein
MKVSRKRLNVSPFILDFGSGYKYVVSFKLQPLLATSWERTLYLLDSKLNDLEDRSGSGDEDKDCAPTWNRTPVAQPIISLSELSW